MAKHQNSKSTSKPDRMPGASRVEVNDFRSWVFYGRSGTGKTTLACSFPSPIILLDIKDEGTDSVADVKGLDVREIEDQDEMEEAYYWLKKHPRAYKTIVIDTVSMWQQMVISELVGDTGRKGKKAGDWGSMTQKDWGKVAGVMKEWLVNYRDLAKELEVNVVFIAQDRVFNMSDEEDEGRDDQIAPEVGPALSPAVAKILNAAVSVIGNTFIRTKRIKKEEKGKIKKEEKQEYCLRIGPNPSYVTKVRKPKSVAAPSFIADPSYEDIMELIKGED